MVKAGGPNILRRNLILGMPPLMFWIVFLIWFASSIYEIVFWSGAIPNCPLNCHQPGIAGFLIFVLWNFLISLTASMWGVQRAQEKAGWIPTDSTKGKRSSRGRVEKVVSGCGHEVMPPPDEENDEEHAD